MNTLSSVCTRYADHRADRSGYSPLRDAALHTDYTRLPVRTNYPGYNSDDSFEIEELNEIVSRLVHEPVIGTPGTAHCRFRIAMAGAESRSKFNIHVDTN